jgi:hypothetical protein
VISAQEVFEFFVSREIDMLVVPKRVVGVKGDDVDRAYFKIRFHGAALCRQLGLGAWNYFSLRVNRCERLNRANPHAEHTIGAALVDFEARFVKVDGVKGTNRNTGSAKIAFIVDDADHEFSV